MSSALRLPDELTIYTASEVHAGFLSWLHSEAAQAAPSDPLRVAAEGVTDVDAAGVQLLLSLANSLEQRQRGLVLVAPSDCLSEACGVLGVPWLVDPAASQRTPK
jgi:anti-anti-sigma regulatory factor